MIIIGFILGVLFMLVSVSISIWLSAIKKDPLTLAKAISLPRPHAKILEPKTDEQRAREEKLGKHASEGGADLEELL